MIRVLFAAFESLPFIKTGGLADVVYALPRAIDREQFDCKVVMPLLKPVKEKYYEGLKWKDKIYVHSGYINEEADIYSYDLDGVEYFFIDNENYFGRDGVYGFKDDVARFSFFNIAVIEMMIKLDYYPDIIHENDYHTALIPALCKLRYEAIEKIRKIRHIFTIHNLAYQGDYDKQVLFDLLSFDYKDFDNGSLRYNDHCNFMKIGIVFADKVTTVSKTYAMEIQTPERGENLDVILKYRREDLYGIVNGIDTEAFNPYTDKAIAYPYNTRNYLKGKRENKLALQKELGLKEEEDTLLLGMVSRLTFQKGADLLLGCMGELLKRNVQIAILGTGESRYEYAFRMLEDEHRGRFVYYCGYNEALAHRMYAGLDLLLMPSLFEPCGLSQLIAMRYGTLPLVRETGGLKDTVEPYNEYTDEGRGFTFGPYNAWDMLSVIDYAYTQYYDHKDAWKNLIKRAMRYDVSFARSAREYEEVYRKALNG